MEHQEIYHLIKEAADQLKESPSAEQLRQIAAFCDALDRIVLEALLVDEDVANSGEKVIQYMFFHFPNGNSLVSLKYYSGVLNHAAELREESRDADIKIARKYFDGLNRLVSRFEADQERRADPGFELPFSKMVFNYSLQIEPGIKTVVDWK